MQSYIHANARSACSSRSTATPTSSPATTTSSRSPRTSRCTSPAAAPQYVSRGGRPDEAPGRAELRVYEQEAADKPENVRAEDRRGQAAQVVREVVLLKQQHVNGDKYDGKTIEQLRAELSGQDRRERRDPPLRALRGRPVAASVADDAPAFTRILLKLSGEALMGSLDYGTDPERLRAVAHQVKRVHDRGVEVAIVVGAGNIYRGMAGRRGGDGPRHRRLHGHARDRPQRARRCRTRWRRWASTRACSRRSTSGGRRALHPPPRDAPPREGPRRDLRRGHRQPVLHDRHRRRAAGHRDPRRGHPDGQERRRGRLHRRPARGPRRASSSPRSRTWRRSSGACA